MSLTTVPFLLFLLVAVAVYYLLPKKIQWIWLLIASTFFYFYYDWKLGFWIFLSAAIIYVAGILLQRTIDRYAVRLENAPREERKALKAKKKRALSLIKISAVLLNIGIWVFFKFADLFIGTLNQYLAAPIAPLNLILPLGISFYTFSAISYVVDISREKIPAEKNPFRLALWLTFFPQLLQGPIVRFQDTAEQLFTPHRISYDRIKSGCLLMLWGYFKKMVIADRAAVIVATIFGNFKDYSGLTFLFGSAMYAIQIYGDFSGGMDIITGAAELFGITMPKNFEQPYFSVSVPEYWRRWHITLGAWFRDYIFYPLSISKSAQKIGKFSRKILGTKIGKTIPTYLSLIIVWTSNGIWHGAGLRYAAYGFYWGILTILSVQCGPLLKRLTARLKIRTDAFSWRFWQMFRTFFLVCFGRVLIKAPSLMTGLRIWKSIVTEWDPWIFTSNSLYQLGLAQKEVRLLFLAIGVLLFVDILHEKGVHIRETVSRQNLVFRWLLYLAAIFAIIIFGMYGPGYNAAEFIYGRF